VRARAVGNYDDATPLNLCSIPRSGTGSRGAYGICRTASGLLYDVSLPLIRVILGGRWTTATRLGSFSRSIYMHWAGRFAHGHGTDTDDKACPSVVLGGEGRPDDLTGGCLRKLLLAIIDFSSIDQITTLMCILSSPMRQ
jgi:hypothetical protein